MHMRRKLSIAVAIVAGATISVSAIAVALPADSAPPPVGVGGSWRNVFEENFAGSEIDRSTFPDCHWATGKGCTGQNADELQQFRPENVTVGGGAANLTAKRQSVFVPESQERRSYTSGSLSTGPWSTNGGKPSFDFQYGYVEARLRVAPGQGVWTSFWLEPSNLKWPPEVDVIEAPNLSPTKLYSNVHSGTASQRKQSNQAHVGPVWSDGYHVFGLQWTSSSLTWFIDGEPVRTVSDPAQVPRERMYPVINVSVGGWARTPPPSTVFPATASVDYLRVWQR